jgi:hypothetical protein
VVQGLRVFDRDHDRRRPRVEIELLRRRPRIGEQALLELGIDPRARHEARTVGW